MVSGQEEESITYLLIAISYCNDEVRKNRLKAIVDVYQNKLESALNHIQEAINIEGKTARNVEILSNIFLKQGMYELALQVIDECDDVELSTLKGYILLAQKRFEEVIELAEQHLKDDPSKVNWLLLKVEALVMGMESDISNKKPLDTDYVVKQAMSLIKKIEKNYIENIAVITRIKEFKAALYFRNQQFSEAKLYYEELYRIENGSDSIYFKNYLWICICDQDFEKAISLLDPIVGVESPNIDDVSDLAKLYVDAGKPQDAISLLEKYNNLFNNEEQIKINFYIPFMDALFLTLQYEKAKQLIDLVESESTDHVGVSALKAYYYSQLHEWEKAIQYWEESVNSLDKNFLIESKLQLSLAYLNRGNLEDLKKLKELIVSIPNWMHHEPLVDRYVRALYGLGEYKQIISLSKELSENSIFLLDVKFPEEEPLLKQFKGIEEDGRLGEDLINELKRSTEATVELLNYYNENKLPMSFLVAISRREPFQTWVHVENDKKMSIWALQGTREELVNGLIFAKRSTGILCDLTTLYTIRHLGLLDWLKDKYELFIHQDDADRVFKEYLNSKLICEDGLKMMSYENGRVIIREYSPEQVQGTFNEQEEILEWINTNCKKLGNIIEDRNDEKTTIDFINHPIKVSKQNNLSLLVDNYMTIAYAREGYEVRGFTTYAFVNVLFAEGKITRIVYNETIGKLLLMGYSLIPVKKDLFAYYLDKNIFKLNDEVINLFDYLKRDEFSVEYLIELVANIFGWIWIEAIPDDDRQRLTDYLCYVMTYKRNKVEVTETLIENSKTKFSPLVQHQWEKMHNNIMQWLKSKLIV
jgi:tetratricopeptide (TPR) repeat protein